MRRIAAAALVLASGLAHADPDPASASRDAPVLEYAYGPRAQLSVGHWLEGRAGRVRLGLSGLAALENASGRGPLPDELGRLVLDGWLAVSLPRGGRALGGALALELDLGVERARALVGPAGETREPSPSPGDIPFGGGGSWLGASVELRRPLAPGAVLSLRAGERTYWNAWPLLLGYRASSDVIADSLGEGLSWLPWLGGSVRWAPRPRLAGVAALHLEVLVPHDRSADLSARGRLLVGAGLPHRAGLGLLFLSLDAGSGAGLLVNRHELRLSIGVRHAR